VKLRPVVPDELPKALRKSEAFNVEVDAMPGGFVCSATLKARADNAEVREVARGELKLKRLLSKEQRALFSERAPDGVALDGLSLLGPILVLKLRLRPAELGRRLVVEAWAYPDGSRILELSTKCEPGEAFQVAAQARAFLSERGVDLSGDQETKTRKALRLFSKRMEGAV
jgi:hypothetical protein